MKTLKIAAFILLILGGLNWGLRAISFYDVVIVLFGHWPMLVRLVYGLIGLSAVWFAFDRPRIR
jgi:uncharacterized membrane protein YuzA (DUF378 family)